MSILIAAALLASQAKADPTLPAPDKVVVTVNGHKILAREVQAYLWDWEAPQVGQTLAYYEMIKEEAVRHKALPTEAEVAAQTNLKIQELLARFPKGASPEDAFKQSGTSRSKIQFGVRVQLMLSRLANLQFDANRYYKVSTIVVKPTSESAADLQAALSSANTAYGNLENGASWDKVLTQTATDPQNANNHGELGWLELNQFPPTVRTELPKLKVSEVTKPVQTPNGIQIFRLEARGKDATVGEMTELRARFLQNAERNIMSRLQKDAKITTSY